MKKGNLRNEGHQVVVGVDDRTMEDKNADFEKEPRMRGKMQKTKNRGKGN